MEDKFGVASKGEQPMDVMLLPRCITPVTIYRKSTAEVGSSLVENVRSRFISCFRSSMNIHQVLIILAVDTGALGCVADSLQERGFSSIAIARPITRIRKRVYVICRSEVAHARGNVAVPVFARFWTMVLVGLMVATRSE